MFHNTIRPYQWGIIIIHNVVVSNREADTKEDALVKQAFEPTRDREPLRSVIVNRDAKI